MNPNTSAQALGQSGQHRTDAAPLADSHCRSSSLKQQFSKKFCNLVCFRAQPPGLTAWLTLRSVTRPGAPELESKYELIYTVLVWTSLLAASGFVKVLLILLQHHVSFHDVLILLHG